MAVNIHVTVYQLEHIKAVRPGGVAEVYDRHVIPIFFFGYGSAVSINISLLSVDKMTPHRHRHILYSGKGSKRFSCACGAIIKT